MLPFKHSPHKLLIWLEVVFHVGILRTGLSQAVFFSAEKGTLV